MTEAALAPPAKTGVRGRHRAAQPPRGGGRSLPDRLMHWHMGGSTETVPQSAPLAPANAPKQAPAGRGRRIITCAPPPARSGPRTSAPRKRAKRPKRESGLTAGARGANATADGVELLGLCGTGALEVRHGPDAFSARGPLLIEEGQLAQGRPLSRLQLEQGFDDLGQVRRQCVGDHLAAAPVAKSALPEEAPEAEGRGVVEKAAAAARRALPRVVLQGHRENDDAESEGVGQEGVDDGLRVDLGSLVGGLPPHLALHRSAQRRHAEVDELHLRPGVRPRDEEVLQGEVAVGDAEVVQHADGLDDVGDNGPDDRLPPRARSRHGLSEAPVVEVPLLAEGARDHGLPAAAKEAVQAADVGVAHGPQEADEADVKPRPLLRLGVPRVELGGAAADPLVGHRLHRREPAPAGAVLHELHAAEVAAASWSSLAKVHLELLHGSTAAAASTRAASKSLCLSTDCEIVSEDVASLGAPNPKHRNIGKGGGDASELT
eukprot:CAMPEP_0176291202 /NCGR_PEP_ID=MMETSP0121_2-20121125/55425_1 /TAXON_ID=160619 /ORGANISM="Kryptoperidinium foliaceum, Strain CCMP 1326" /LENGTH=489 /DNA_ID=CAMNT_0017632033 /DNA_START=308 /DNA_END=1777 /DNA_ORIENTATION=-